MARHRTLAAHRGTGSCLAEGERRLGGNHCVCFRRLGWILSKLARQLVPSTHCRRPRRSHRIRDRPGRYAVGAWINSDEPSLTCTLKELRDKITFGNPQKRKLPDSVKTQIQSALTETFPTGAPGRQPGSRCRLRVSAGAPRSSRIDYVLQDNP